ncbi:hypothetical protein [Flavobacterium dankookense]|uniref:6-bladed beta-propeller protein n=1 Tax=Flavobacterium dankookense TaxID=706186 RepID=A0A4R6QCQ8_9FLAO|nr:hypothetical protein [Flavobacterium dankookense]TDP60135.1 hypothetical protein BC748_1110 [Flavobacterium dankookense]
MKKIIFILLFMSVQLSSAVELFSYKLNENEKLEGNFSLVVNDKETCHFLFIKNTESKKYIVKSCILSSERKIKQLDDLVLEVEPNFYTSHTNGDVLTVSSYDEKKEMLTVIDFNMATGKSNFQNLNNFKPDLYFNQNNRSILVNLGKNDVYVQVITNTKSTEKKVFNIPESIIKDYKNIKNGRYPIEGINQSEFVKNGSINKSRAYLGADNLYFTTSKDDSQTGVLKFDLNTDVVKSQSIDYNFNSPYIDRNTFIFDEKLYVSSLSANDVVIKSFNLLNNSENGKLSVMNDLSNIVDNTVVQDYFSQTKLANLKTTITVNKTIDNLYKIRIDRVNKFAYMYNYNWWWQHQFMRMQMQMMQMNQIRSLSMPGGFGPSAADFDDDLIMISSKAKEYNYFEFVVDANFIPQKNSTSETKYKNFEIDELIKEFENNSSIKKFAPAFLKDEMRYIYQNNKTKEIIIDFKKI